MSEEWSYGNRGEGDHAGILSQGQEEAIEEFLRWKLHNLIYM